MTMKRLVFLPVLCLLLSLDAAPPPAVYPSRTPPKLQPADAASRLLLQQAQIDRRRFVAYPLVHILRKAVFELDPKDLSCEVKLNDLIHIVRTHQSLNIPASRQFSGVRAVLPDGRWFDTVPNGMPALPAGTVLSLTGTIRAAASKFLPLQQLNYDMAKNTPTTGFRIEFPASFRHKFYHAPDALLRTRRTEGDRIVYEWHGTIPPFQQNANEVFPRSSRMRLVLTTLRSWDELREWALSMMRPEEELDAAGRALLKKLTAGASGKTEQVRRIYDYLNRLRYLTVPVGEAKFRPQKIGDMIRNGYGDCKDKSNALYVFCRELGIPAERVLVNSGGTVDPDFPSWQFNHMIVYIPELPGYPSGLWLDPAGGQAPFGELPAGTLDSLGLVLSDRTQFRQVAPADQEKAHSRIHDTMFVDRYGNVRFQSKQTGLFAVQFRIFLNRNANQLRTGTERLLDTLVPGADLVRFSANAPQANYEFRAKLSLAGVLPALTIPGELTRPFISSSVPRPVRLYDGHRVTFSRKVIAEGRRFRPVSWQIRRDRYFAALQVRDCVIEYSFGLLRQGDNRIPPLLYKEIRSTLNQLRIRLNNIGEIPAETAD